MFISIDNIEKCCEESEVFNHLLSLDNKHIVELGCGKADLTRKIASCGTGRRLTAFEIDEIQHAENLKVKDLPNVIFKHGGAQVIAEPDDSADAVFMFKSLHHVPLDAMEAAFSEIQRILKTDGFLYVSEPIFAGEFNEILRLFHNEQAVRNAAFNAEKGAIEAGKFKLVKQIFFNSPMHFPDFAAFEDRILGVTHTNFVLSPDIFKEVKSRLEGHMGDDGAHFKMPIRVDLLQVVK